MSEKKLLMIVLPLALFCGCFIAMAIEQMTATGGSSVDGRYAFAARDHETAPGGEELIDASQLQKIAARKRTQLSARLIQQAEQFAAHMQRQETDTPEDSKELKLMGISYCQSDPAESMVLIKAGSSSKWLRQSDRIADLRIESIAEDAVSVSDGRKTFMMSPEP